MALGLRLADVFIASLCNDKSFVRHLQSYLSGAIKERVNETISTSSNTQHSKTSCHQPKPERSYMSLKMPVFMCQYFVKTTSPLVGNTLTITQICFYFILRKAKTDDK